MENNEDSPEQPRDEESQGATTPANEENKDEIKVEDKLDPDPDPVILELLKWLEQNLPDQEPEAIFKLVRRLQKVFDILISLPLEYFFANTGITPKSEDYITNIIDNLKEYIIQSEDKQLKNRKLEASAANLDLKREQYKLVTSINLDDCMDRISRHNRVMSKKINLYIPT